MLKLCNSEGHSSADAQAPHPQHQALTLDLDLRPSPKCCTRVFMTLEMSNNPFFIKLDYLNESANQTFLNKWDCFAASRD